MNVKSKSKNLFSHNNKILIDPLIKRHKSQESYTDVKSINHQKSSRGSKPKIRMGLFSLNKNTKLDNKLSPDSALNTIKSIKTAISNGGNTGNSNYCNSISKFKSDTRNIDDSMPKIENEENNILATHNFLEHINNLNTIDSNALNNTNYLNEIRSSHINNNFYTNSIAEASSSVLEKGEGLINNLPKPFVKQAERKMGNLAVNTNNFTNHINVHNHINPLVCPIDRFNRSPLRQDDEKIKQKLEVSYRKLLSFAKKGDRDGFLNVLSKIFKIQSNKTNINYKDESGWTSLHFAADEGNLKIVEILMKMNVDVNSKTLNKKTPLHFAADKGYFDISRILIENGATIAILDDEKNNPVHICASKGHVELLKYFLEKYPQADSKNIYGKSPIDLAKNEKVRELLNDYFCKNTYQYHKIKIHDIETKLIDNKSNLNNVISSPIINIMNNSISKVDVSFSNKKKCLNRLGNKLNLLKSNQNKFQSNDYGVINDFSGKNNLSTTNNITCCKINNININTSGCNSNSSKVKKISNINARKDNSLGSYGHNCNSNGISNPNSNSNSLTAKSNNNLNSIVHNSIKSHFNKIQNFNSKIVCNTINDNEEAVEDEETINPLTSLEEEKIGPSSFYCHALLGKGSFGEVYLVEKKNTKILYAMKVLSKDKIMGQNLVKYAMTERNVLSITDHPFIVKLSYAFQSQDTLFLILDYCPGGDLAQHLTKEKKFNEERAKIYICELILALEDLHKRDIIFRDLKPDNVVLDRQGHALLTDFGLSKEGVLDNKCAKSFCGSIAYLAPEMLKRTGHGKSVDWYLLGVLFYEMLVGIPPYFTNNKYYIFNFRREALFKNIEFSELQYPSSIGETTKSILKGLLNKDPHIRLGAGNLDADEIKNHPYFKDVNWDDVYKRKLTPPIPNIKNRVLEQYSKPKIFHDYSELVDDEDNQNSKNTNKLNYFNGWSFVKHNNNISEK